MPCLRYVLFEILHDAKPKSNPPSAPAPAPVPVPLLFAASDPAFVVERRFWRIDRSEDWLCLDALDERAGRRVMDADGLSFDDRVRYWA